jgi:hypothetical protein
MKSLPTILILTVLAAASTTTALGKAGPSQAGAAPAPLVAKLELNRVVIRAVHGPVQYWDGSLWAALRPNLVLTNGLEFRPGADSSFDLFGGEGVCMRLTADHRQKIRAFLVRCGKVSESGAAGALGADGRVRVDTGEMVLTGNGKTYRLHVGEYFDATTDEVRDDASLPSARADVASAPRALAFDAGLAKARRGIYGLNE